MFKRGLVLVTLASSLAWTAPAAAKLFKWVDEHGTTHYGETIPPEYANRSSQTIDKGRVENRTEEYDPNKRQAMQEAAEKKKADEAAAAEQKRRDNALLNTYSNEKEIDLARNRSVQLLEARVKSFSTMAKSAQEAVDEHHKEVEEDNKAGRKPPQSLLDDVAGSEARLGRLQKDLANAEREIADARARFDADVTRYRELKGSPPKP